MKIEELKLNEAKINRAIAETERVVCAFGDACDEAAKSFDGLARVARELNRPNHRTR